MEKPDEARVVLRRALETSREANDPSEEATSLNNLAILDEAGNLNSSHSQYRRSIELSRDLEDRRKLASTLNNLGVLLGKKGENDEALQAWNEAMSILEKIGDTSTLASTHNNIGVFLERRGDPLAAIKHYSDALVIQEKLGDRRAPVELTPCDYFRSPEIQRAIASIRPSLFRDAESTGPGRLFGAFGFGMTSAPHRAS
jgi:tetratricopeptide (TPR) repeat protein